MKHPYRTPIVLAVGLVFASLACNLGRLSATPASSSPLSPTFPTTDLLPVPTEEISAPGEAVGEATQQPTLQPAASATEIAEPTTFMDDGQGFFTEYSVILVEAGDVLNVRQAAGVNQPVVAELTPGETGITLTGREQQAGGDRWVEIRQPQAGQGWVNAYYLTEAVTPQDFCRDERVNALLAELDSAITASDGDLLSRLVSPAHGLNLQYFHNGNTANYTTEEAKWVFQSDYEMNWGTHPASGLEVKGTFRKEVLPTLQEVFASDYSLECNSPELGGGNYIYTWPVKYASVNYYLIQKPGTPGVDLDWRSYLAGVEYVGGRPFLFALVHFFWEP